MDAYGLWQRDPFDGILAVVAAVARRQGVIGFEDVGRLISAYLYDPERWTVEEACYKGLPRLVCCLMAAGFGYRTDPAYVAYLFNKSITRWSAAGDLERLIDFNRCLPKLVRTHAVAAAAGRGRTKVLDWLLDCGPLVVWPVSAYARAALRGELVVLRWFRSHGFDIIKDHLLLESVLDANLDEVTSFLWPLYQSLEDNALIMSAAVSKAPLHMAQWMVSSANTSISVCIDKPATRGDLEYLRWAQEHDATATTLAMDGAAGEGHLDVVIWLHEMRSEGCTSSAIDLAAAHGHLAVVKWLAHNRTEGCTDEALFGAAVAGELGALRWLLERWPALIVPPTTFDHVCAKGHLDVAQFLTVRCAGGGSHHAMDWAAGNDHIEVLNFLQQSRREGCSAAAMDCAAANASMGALEWLARHRQEGCTTAAMDLAVGNGEYEVVSWLRQHSNEGCSGRAMQLAARSGDLDMVAWLHKAYHLRSSGRAIDAAIHGGNLKCVRWLHEERGEHASAEATLVAVQRGYFSILEYLRVNGSVSCAADAFKFAVDTGQLYIAAWVANNYPQFACLSNLESSLSLNGWTKDIVRAVFGYTTFESARALVDHS